ncbi:anti-sigma-I factor RsgI family protein [Clostridium weizhouense]|uniref:Anti-sigma factor RsgI-like middle domain-containing protein n=1 Tax=Clostridium weizhouense TaxID=2859781 RepID=A0ABS7AQY6_9CLOT|nr:hypothetical protein [Clostridium weizhouense]MBW6410086.1 hypothetical protein [Clostridium weizhouense]
MEKRLTEVLDEINIEDTSVLLEDDINLRMNPFVKRNIMKSVKKKVENKKENYTINKRKNHNFMNELLGGFFMKRKLILSAALIVGIMTVGIGGYSYATTPKAYVSLDINPSVELGVNAFDKVVSVEGYNEDGEKILENEDLINENINDAVEELISNAIENGYVTPDNEAVISITTATDDIAMSEELQSSLENVTNEVLENNNIEAEIQEDNVALQRREEARQLGITPGKLNLIQKLQALDPNIKVEDYKDTSVKEIQKKNKELRKNNINTEENNDDVLNKDETNIQNEEKNKQDLNKDINEAEENQNKEKNNNKNQEKEYNEKKPENDNSNKEKDNIDNGNSNSNKAEKGNVDKGNSNSNKSEKNNNSSNGQNKNPKKQ